MKQDPKHEAWLKYGDVLQFFESASFEMVFKAGWDARDKRDHEALSVALEALEKLSKPYDVNYETNYYAICEYDKRTAQITLTKIKEIRGIE